MSILSSSSSPRTGSSRPSSAIEADPVDGSAYFRVPPLSRSLRRPASVTLSEICGDKDMFAYVLHGSRVDLATSSEHLDFLVNDLTAIKAGVTSTEDGRKIMTNRPFGLNDNENLCLEQLCEMVQVGPEDPYQMSKHAFFLIFQWLAFVDVMPSANEARFRGPLDQLIMLAFSGDALPRLQTSVEVPLKASFLPEAVCDNLSDLGTVIAEDAKAYIDCAVLRKLEFVDKKPYPEIMLHSGFEVSHVLAEVVIEYNIANQPQMENQVVLDMTASLYHRRYLGLVDKPIYGIAIAPSHITWFYGCWKPCSRDGSDTSRLQEHSQDRISINRLQRPALLTFADWMCFYVTLMRLRERLQNVEPIVPATIPSVPVEQVVDDMLSMGSPPTLLWSPGIKRRRSYDNTMGSQKHPKTDQVDTISCPTPRRLSSPPEWLVC